MTTIHFLAPITIVTGPGDGVAPRAEVMDYGTELELTERILQLNQRPDGSSIFDLVGDEERQVSCFNTVVFRPGTWPEGVVRVRPGDPRWERMREAARQAAHAVVDDSERARQLRQVRRDFGEPRPTSRTTATYGERP